MTESIQAIYKNGALHPLKPLGLPEGEVVEIDVRDVSDSGEKEQTNAEKLKAFEEWMENLNHDTPGLTDEQINRESIYEEQIKRQL
jgi:predicted DNA-binding antitoxin AbrB/MazE fold protein